MTKPKLPKVVVDVRDEPLKDHEIIKCFGLQRKEGFWTMVSVELDENDRLIKVERTLPNPKLFAINALKIANSKQWDAIG